MVPTYGSGMHAFSTSAAPSLTVFQLVVPTLVASTALEWRLMRAKLQISEAQCQSQLGASCVTKQCKASCWLTVLHYWGICITGSRKLSERPATHDWRLVIIVARRSGAGYISCRWKGREEAIAVSKQGFVVTVSVALNIGGLDGADKGKEF